MPPPSRTAGTGAALPGDRDRTTDQDMLARLAERLAGWLSRRRQRRALLEMDDRLLDDIGISRGQARREAAGRRQRGTGGGAGPPSRPAAR